MVAYEYYRDTYQGNLDQIEFVDLEPGVSRLIDSYIKSILPHWKIRPLSEYDIDFNDVICMQVDFIAENGGKAALNGSSDFNVSTVSTKGFSYQMKAKQVPMFNNVPLSPMMLSELRYILREAGLLSRCL